LVEEVELFAGLEAHGLAGSDADFSAGAWIAANAGFPGPDVEDAEAAKLDALAFGQGVLQGFEDGIDGSLGLIALEAGTLNHLVNNVLFYQGVLPSGEWSDPRLILETFSSIVNAALLP
jgi:hypothetical protein